MDDLQKNPPDHEPDKEAMEAVYHELRRIARRKMRGERGEHTLQPTALVNELYLRLLQQPGSIWKDRHRVIRIAARMMRNILVDYARAHKARKRGAGAIQVTFDDQFASVSGSFIDVLMLDQALNTLASFDPRQAKIVELHFFGGLTFEEIASIFGMSTKTIMRDWSLARAWLRTELEL